MVSTELAFYSLMVDLNQVMRAEGWYSSHFLSIIFSKAEDFILCADLST
jgi:hypothetical protein